MPHIEAIGLLSLPPEHACFDPTGLADDIALLVA